MSPVLPEIEFELFRNFLKKKTGITIRPSKRRAFSRKLVKRVKALGMTSFTTYYRMLKSEDGANELRILINQVTIDLTRFFRGDSQFALLASDILPGIMRNNNSTRCIRVWSAGCSRGHESYSLAMMIREAARETITWDIKILATDIDSDSLKFAHRGRYNSEEMANVPDEYIEKYFRVDNKSGYGVFKDLLKKNVVFRRLNLLEFPYPLRGPMDMIFCRNVMIYFSPTSKKKIMNEFLRLLPAGGYLCLGSAESLLGIDDRFSLIGHAVYRKKA